MRRQSLSAWCLASLALLARQAGVAAAASGKTLVLYSISDDTAESAVNLEFFLKHGVQPNDTKAHFLFMHAANSKARSRGEQAYTPFRIARC